MHNHHKPMNKTIGTIGAVTLLISSLFMAQAQEHRDEGISREEFARAATVLKKGAAEGKISEEAAKVGIEGLRKRFAAQHERDGERNPREVYAHAEAELKKAVKDGKITEEQAWTKWGEIKKSHIGPRLKKAVESGEMSGEDARAIWRI